MDRIENDTCSNSSSVSCVFIAAITFLPSRCVATIGDTQTDGRDYDVRRYDGFRYHTKFRKDWIRHSEVDRRDSQTHRQHDDLISLLSFF
jgi:hypothetical protein